MQKSIHTVIYSHSGAVLVALKSDESWQVDLPQPGFPLALPQALCGYTLPGGPCWDVDWRSDEALISEARRLLGAHCGRRIEFHQDPSRALNMPEYHHVPVVETVVRFFASYRRPSAAYYLGVPDELFDLIHGHLTDALRSRFRLQQAVAKGQVPLEQLLLEERFLHAPVEAGLRSVEIWDIWLDRDRILQLDAEETRHEFQMLSYLEALLSSEAA